MQPYIKSTSPLKGEQRPTIIHAKDALPGERRRQKQEVQATRRALKKAARREGRREIEERD